jgi:hypothetical protein
MAGPRTLVLEINNLTEHLYRVLQEQVGAPLTELVEHVFDLAKDRRAGDIRHPTNWKVWCPNSMNARLK